VVQAKDDDYDKVKDWFNCLCVFATVGQWEACADPPRRVLRGGGGQCQQQQQGIDDVLCAVCFCYVSYIAIYI